MVTDTGMGMRTKVGLPAPAMSDAMLAANAAKQVLADSVKAASRSEIGALGRGLIRRSGNVLAVGARALVLANADTFSLSLVGWSPELIDEG